MMPKKMRLARKTRHLGQNPRSKRATNTMPFPAAALPPHSVYEPPRILPDPARVDVLWDRPIFRAPPLDVAPTLARLELFPLDPRDLRHPLAS